MITNLLKKKFRKYISTILNTPAYLFLRKHYEVSRDNQPLKPGISAVVAAKDEEYIIPYCLESLIGFADQIICIDNGSKDSTLKLMKKFKADNLDVDVVIISMPNALLGECREAGLIATKHQWHLRWDADMVCKTTGKESMLKLRDKILMDNKPRAIRLPRTNLDGDFQHTSRLKEVVDPGEPILIRFSKYIKYVEYGKFDTIKLPLFYKSASESKRYYFHCEGLKSEERLIYRQCYFIWRDLVNKAKTRSLKNKLENFNDFKKYYEKTLFGTNNLKELKYRHSRQYCILHYQPYSTKKYGEYPKILNDAIKNNEERFIVQYKNNKPYIRVDKKDVEMIDYIPTDDDLNWDVNNYLKSLHNFEKKIFEKYEFI